MMEIIIINNSTATPGNLTYSGFKPYTNYSVEVVAVSNDGETYSISKKTSTMPSQVIHSPLSRPNSVGSVHSAASDSASSGVSTGRGPKRGQDICVSEELRIAIDLAFDKFRNADPDEYHELEFPSSLTSTERAYIHRLAAANNLKSKSRGKNNSRYLTVTRLQTTGLAETAILDVTRNSQQQMMNLMQRCPLTHKEKQDLIPRAHKSTNPQENGELTKMTTGKLNNGLPQVPPRRCPSGVSVPPLPVLSAAAEIVHTVANNQVVLVSGETGCGKTTQVPQMILDSCCESRLPCRIICVQPRRIAALSMAGRVAAERGEEVGQIVGYQIRLESRVSPKTLLTYCTNGVLLRTLIAAENALATVTHVIVDEIHERDRLCDFLLIVLRQAISKYKNLKLILMSATMNTELFLRYFDHCPIIQVPGSLHDVEELYLEDVLKLTGYMSKKMAECKQQLEKVAQGQGRLPVVSDADETEHGIMHRMDDEQMAGIQRDVEDIDLEGTDNDPLDPVIAKEMDKLLKEIWMTGNESLFSQIYHYILSENVSADYQDSETGMTPLMAACAKGLTAAAEQLLNLGANVHFKSISSDCTALKVASHFHQEECVELLHSHMYDGDSNTFDELPTNEIPVDANILLQAYHHSFDDEKIDVDLVLTLLQYIMMTSDSTGAILVFLPGFDDIVVVRERSWLIQPTSVLTGLLCLLCTPTYRYQTRRKCSADHLKESGRSYQVLIISKFGMKNRFIDK
ncbi:YTHDC2 [Bugula neritina]|uniref:RNA helicase n=1 Tax=Bugula neritina TaxID=10212 RepID=A0A7J7IUU0_BUGNE|nr:YTHDC2 [Bugula neritina]